MIRVTPAIALDEAEILEEFVRAPGPGGQNVNKVSSAVQIRFDVRRSPALSAEVRERLIRLAGKRVNDDGVLVVNAHRYRTQPQNRQDALDQLLALIRQAAQRPKPHLRTRPPAAARLRRL